MEETEKTVKIAILDLYEGQANQGMRCIREIINQWGQQQSFDVTFQEFDVRQKNELPDTNFDIYISTGGPGSPLESTETIWEHKYFAWIKSMEQWNADVEEFPKKHVFFICHSFQMACRYYNIGNVCKRNSTAFGVFPIHMTEGAEDEVIFDGLRNPFYGVDSRDFQVIEPNDDAIATLGAKILAIEKDRPHVPYERAIMAMRFNEYFIGTQFHPEADAIGMSMYLQKPDKRKVVIDNHGEEKWNDMIMQLNDPDKILWTYSHILPNFLQEAVGKLIEA